MLQGDPFRCSVYREEAIEAMIGALNCQTCDEKVQERSARTLLMLGGWFSYTGEASTEHWLLQQAGFSYWSRDSFHFKEGFLHSVRLLLLFKPTHNYTILVLQSEK